MTGRKGWLERFLRPDIDRAERRSVEEFAAYRWNGTKLVQEAVRDISSSGVYILTEERWEPGTLVFLTLQRKGQLEMSPDRRIQVLAKVARCGEDGMGMAFVLRDDPESRQWESLRENLIEQSKPKDMITLVRMVEALSFLSQICPHGAEEIGQLLRGRLSNHKVTKAVEIALITQSLLAVEPAKEGPRVKPRLVVQILEDGSCPDEGWLRHFWAGLLAASCATAEKDESNMKMVQLFSQLTTFPVRILVVLCTRAPKILEGSGAISAKPLACTMGELATTTESRRLQVERDLERLSELGLIEKRGSNSPTLLSSDEITVTPTSLGLQLFAYCNGQSGSLREFYALESPETQSCANQ